MTTESKSVVKVYINMRFLIGCEKSSNTLRVYAAQKDDMHLRFIYGNTSGETLPIIADSISKNMINTVKPTLPNATAYGKASLSSLRKSIGLQT